MSNDARWERLRVVVGIALVVFCGLALWRNSVRPLVDKGLAGGELVREVRLGVYRWALEKKRAQFQKEEAEKKQEKEGKAVSPQKGEGVQKREERGAQAGKESSAGTISEGSVSGGSL